MAAHPELAGHTLIDLCNKIKRSIHLLRLSRRYWRPSQVPEPWTAWLCGKRTHIRGPKALALLLECHVADVYGLKQIRRPRVIVDVGANLGAFSLSAWRQHPHAEIHAYEPSAAIWPFLEANTCDSPIKIYPEAVGHSSGDVVLEPGFDSTSSHISHDVPKSDGVEIVRMTTLEGVLARIPSRSISLLKMDCEGSEHDILTSPALDHVERIAAEFHPQGDQTAFAAVTRLRDRGFEIQKWQPFSPHADTFGIVWASNSRFSKHA